MPGPSSSGGMGGAAILLVKGLGGEEGTSAAGLTECHHVFLAPSAGTSAAAYIEEAGVIVSLSARSSGVDARCRVMRQLDGVTSRHAQPRQKGEVERVLTVWEFSQNRIRKRLHELLL